MAISNNKNANNNLFLLTEVIEEIVIISRETNGIFFSVSVSKTEEVKVKKISNTFSP